jgi:formate hydrogenlyase subunit 4
MRPPAPAPRRATCSNVLRSERIKLTAFRSTLIALLVSFAIGIGVSALGWCLAGSHHVSATVAGKGTLNPTTFSLDGIQLAEVALAALVVLVIISESCWSSPRHVPPSSSARP